MTARNTDSGHLSERRRGLIWRGLTPQNQRFYGFDFGWFAVGILLDAPRDRRRLVDQGWPGE